MSDGTINLPKRSTPPSAPTVGRFRIWVDSNDNEVKFIDDLGVIQTFKGDQGDQGDQGVQGIQGIQGEVGPVGPMNVEALINEFLTVTLPNTTAPTIVYSDTVNLSATGNHLLLVFMALRPHSTNNQMEFQVEWDNGIVGPLYSEEGKDASADNSNWRMAMIPLGNQNAGNHTLDLLFSKESTGGTAQLKTYVAAVVRY
jgi:hypothetical protein